MRDELWLPDAGDGFYQNPVLFCDYSDPDVIRAGDTYYMTASSFNYVPGLPILTSKDLVNWTLANYALETIPHDRYATPRHAQGVWAPAIRFHDGWFYIYYGMPDEGIFMVRARDPLGRWETPVCVLEGKGLIDPCPFWDDDGRAYVVHGYARSRIGFKSFLGIFPMSPDGTHATGDDHLLYNGMDTQPTIEGPKVYRRGEYVYIFAPAGGVPTGWQTVLRSKSIHGPFEERVVLEQGDTPVNGPHQGGWVTTPEGEDWFLHFQSRGLYGRVTHLQPMHWTEDGWPVMGDGGKPVLRWQKPLAPACKATGQQMSDDFRGTLGLQWQFMGNWRKERCEVGNGLLRLHACSDSGTLWQCANVLTQKVAAPAFTATVQLDAAHLENGTRAGMVLIGGQYGGVAVCRQANALCLQYISSASQQSGEQILAQAPLQQSTVTLRITLKPTGCDAAQACFSYSLDGVTFTSFGPAFAPERHTWVGARVALMCTGSGGHAEFGPFTVEKEE